MAAQTPQCLFPFYTIGFALGDEPTLASDSAEDAALDDLLAETLQQLILAFIWSQNHACHVLTPSRVYSLVRVKSQTRIIVIEGGILVNGEFLKGEGSKAGNENNEPALCIFSVRNDTFLSVLYRKISVIFTA